MGVQGPKSCKSSKVICDVFGGSFGAHTGERAFLLQIGCLAVQARGASAAEQNLQGQVREFGGAQRPCVSARWRVYEFAGAPLALAARLAAHRCSTLRVVADAPLGSQRARAPGSRTHPATSTSLY